MRQSGQAALRIVWCHRARKLGQELSRLSMALLRTQRQDGGQQSPLLPHGQGVDSGEGTPENDSSEVTAPSMDTGDMQGRRAPHAGSDTGARAPGPTCSHTGEWQAGSSWH